VGGNKVMINDKRLKDLRYTIYYKMSVSNTLNKVFYNDISNIILDYIMVNPSRVRYNKKVALIQFLGRWRVYKNIPNINRKNKVHEVLDGFKQYSILPESTDYALYHPKTIERQEKQNNYYNTI
jgi:hypothetical protein